MLSFSLIFEQTVGPTGRRVSALSLFNNNLTGDIDSKQKIETTKKLYSPYTPTDEAKTNVTFDNSKTSV